ncbi:MAG: RNA polymerase sigma factor [Acetivibrionales bacterium]|jgi:DNA-directed RNA polymerase specialized sigma24 family protein
MKNHERQLLKSAAKGSVAAYEEIIGPYRKKVYNFMLKSCGDESEAYRLALEVFVKVFEMLISGEDLSIPFTIYKTAGELSRQAGSIVQKIS